MVALFIGPVSGWNRERSLFMSAKRSLGDIMATKMHASDDTIILNNKLIMQMRDMESVILT